MMSATLIRAGGARREGLCLREEELVDTISLFDDWELTWDWDASTPCGTGDGWGAGENMLWGEDEEGCNGTGDGEIRGAPLEHA